MRTAQHLLTRLLNSLNGDVEYGGQIAALALLGLPSNVFSADFSVCFILPALEFVRKTLKTADIVQEDDDDGDGDDDDDEDDGRAQCRDELLFAEQLNEIALDKLADGDFDLNDGDEGWVHVVRDDASSNDDSGNDSDDDDDDNVDVNDDDDDANKNQSNFVAQHVTYRYRGQQLADYSLYEFVGIVAVKKGAANGGGVGGDGCHAGPGRPANATFAFDARHPQAATHCLSLKSKLAVPILGGARVPRHPGPRRRDPAWRRAADAFAAYVITLHVPWVLDSGVPQMPLTFAALLRHVRRLATSARYVDRARLHWIRCLAQVCFCARCARALAHLSAGVDRGRDDAENVVALARSNGARVECAREDDGSGGDDGRRRR